MPAEDLAAIAAQDPPAAGTALLLGALPGLPLPVGAGALVAERSCGTGAAPDAVAVGCLLTVSAVLEAVAPAASLGSAPVSAVLEGTAASVRAAPVPAALVAAVALLGVAAA